MLVDCCAKNAVNARLGIRCHKETYCEAKIENVFPTIQLFCNFNDKVERHSGDWCLLGALAGGEGANIMLDKGSQ